MPKLRRYVCSRASWIGMRCAEEYDRIRDVMAEVFDGFEDFNRRVRLPLGVPDPPAGA